LGEAQLLGMPCVASYVGGSPDMMRDHEEYLYRFEEVEMLAEKIMKAFEVRERCDNSVAMKRHSAEVNGDTLFYVYKGIL
jgi:glycosyltransferase involved in cell wall biosynthesis